MRHKVFKPFPCFFILVSNSGRRISRVGFDGAVVFRCKISQTDSKMTASRVINPTVSRARANGNIPFKDKLPKVGQMPKRPCIDAGSRMLPPAAQNGQREILT